MADGGHFEKMSAQKACGRDIIWTVVWIGFKFDVVVRWLFRMIWLTFWEKNIKSKMADIGYFENVAAQKNFLARYLMKRWLDRIQIWRDSFLGICDDLINFWE